MFADWNTHDTAAVESMFYSCSTLKKADDTGETVFDPAKYKDLHDFLETL